MTEVRLGGGQGEVVVNVQERKCCHELVVWEVVCAGGGA